MMFFTLFAFVTFALSNVEEKNNRLLQTNNALLQALKVLTGTEEAVGAGCTLYYNVRCDEGYIKTSWGGSCGTGFTQTQADNLCEGKGTALAFRRDSNDKIEICCTGKPLEFIGCFDDSSSDRNLPVFKGSGLFRKTCRKACVDYKYFGMQAPKVHTADCWCGNQYGGRGHNQVANSYCDDQGIYENMGGENRNAVYKTLQNPCEPSPCKPGQICDRDANDNAICLGAGGDDDDYEKGVGILNGEFANYDERQGQTLTVLDDSNETCAAAYRIQTSEECKEISRRVPGLDKSNQEDLEKSDDSLFSPKSGDECVFDSIDKTVQWNVNIPSGTLTPRRVCYAPAVVFVDECSLLMPGLTEEECARLTPYFTSSDMPHPMIYETVYDKLSGCQKDEMEDAVYWNHGHGTLSGDRKPVCWGPNFCKQVWKQKWYQRTADASYQGILGPVCGTSEGFKYRRLTPNFCLEFNGKILTGDSRLQGDSETMDVFNALCDGGEGDVCAKAAALMLDSADVTTSPTFRVVELVCGVYKGEQGIVFGGFDGDQKSIVEILGEPPQMSNGVYLPSSLHPQKPHSSV